MTELTQHHEDLGIRFKDGFYWFRDFKYKELKMAVSYAESQTGIYLADGSDLTKEDSGLGIEFRDGRYFYQGGGFSKLDDARKSARSQASHATTDSSVSKIIAVTSDLLPTKEITAVLGTARGSTVRAKHVGRDIAAGLKNIVGGEIIGYTEMMTEAREEAIYRMKLDAIRLGANAVIAFRFASATIDAGSAEVTAYGTAVWAEENDRG